MSDTRTIAYMNSLKWLLASSLVCAPLTGAFADGGKTKGSDATADSVAALKAKLGDAASFELDDARVTKDNVVCINYFVTDAQGAKRPGHAVVQNNEVLRSNVDERFEKVWSDNCLGPHGGTAPVQ
jgi:predicted MPP superfamily phosphohydrolase